MQVMVKEIVMGEFHFETEFSLILVLFQKLQ